MFPKCELRSVSSQTLGQCWNTRQLSALSVRKAHSLVNITNPDPTKHPKYKQSRAVQCSLGPGDALFIPSFWYFVVIVHSLVNNMCVQAPRGPIGSQAGDKIAVVDHCLSVLLQDQLSVSTNFWYAPQHDANFFAKAVAKNPLS